MLNVLSIERKQFKEWRQYIVTELAKDLEAIKNDTGFPYKDKNASIDFTIPKDTVGNGVFNFSYNAEINYAKYWRKGWFLEHKKR